MTQIKITGVYTPSEAQKAARIMGTASFCIVDDDGNDMVYLNGVKILEKKDGSARFLSMPSYKVGDNWRSHFRIFPSGPKSESRDAQRGRMDSITEEVLRILDSGGTPSKSTSQPAATTASDSPTPWG